MIFSFRESEHERIEVDVHGYERAAVGEYWDDNWLTVDIRVQAGGFRGKAAASILTAELAKLLSDLQLLYQNLSGSTEFRTMEEQLTLRFLGDGKGHIELRGEVADQAGIGNRLHFTLQLDPSQLGESVGELARVTQQLPIR